ncbi:hypothetical protein ACS5PU_02170 [Pedobacter sp. GSP4]
MVFTIYLAYVLSFKKAISAFMLHSQLEQTAILGGEPATAIAQLEREHGFYLSVLKAYRVKADERENRLWQSVSGMAIATGVSISFSPEDIKGMLDTSVVDSSIVLDRFSFSGGYANLVKLLDTVSKAKGIGRIASAKIGTEASTGGTEEKKVLILKIRLAAEER